MENNSLINRIILNLILISVIIFSPLSQAKMYKWVDDEGNTHYTQSPPPDGIESEMIKTPSKVDTKAAQGALENQKKMADELMNKRKELNEQAAEAEEEQADLDKRCENARKRVASFQRPRVNTVDKDGNRTQVSEEQRQKSLAEAQQYVSENCN